MVAPKRRIENDEDLSHFGSRRMPLGGRAFKNRPQGQDASGLSVEVGRLTPEEASMVVRLKSAEPGDGVRHSTAGRVRSAGFEVEHDPTRRSCNHAVVKYPGLWDDAIAERFDACFDEPQWKE